VKQGTKVCANCRITVYKMSKTCHLYNDPGADDNELQKVEQRKNDSSHNANDASTSNITTEILHSSLQAIRE
jgi:hypothetical protein